MASAWGDSWGVAWGDSWGSGSSPAVVTAVIGGAGRPVYQKRKWRETKQVIEEGLQAVYEEIVTAGLPKKVEAQAVNVIKPFTEDRAKLKNVPKASEVDWNAVKLDLQAARTLLEIHARHVAEFELQEEDEFVLLH